MIAVEVEVDGWFKLRSGEWATGPGVTWGVGARRRSIALGGWNGCGAWMSTSGGGYGRAARARVRLGRTAPPMPVPEAEVVVEGEDTEGEVLEFEAEPALEVAVEAEDDGRRVFGRACLRVRTCTPWAASASVRGVDSEGGGGRCSG